MAPSAQTHGTVEDLREVLLGGIQHRPGRVVHRAEKHSREWQGDIVFWVCISAPLAPLIAANAFIADQIRPGTRDSSRLLDTMKVNQHLALGSLATYLVKKVDH